MSDEVPTVAQHFTIDDIGYTLLRHTEREKTMQDKIDKLYTVVVTGNGQPPLVETVRKHDAWISSVNKLVWLFVGAIVVQLVASSCSFVAFAFWLLSNYSAQTP